MVRRLMHVHDAQKGGHVDRHKFVEDLNPDRPRATFGAYCRTCGEGIMHANHDPTPEAPPAKVGFAGVAQDLAQAIRDAQSLDHLTWKWTLDTMSSLDVLYRQAMRESRRGDLPLADKLKMRGIAKRALDGRRAVALIFGDAAK